MHCATFERNANGRLGRFRNSSSIRKWEGSKGGSLPSHNDPYQIFYNIPAAQSVSPIFKGISANILNAKMEAKNHWKLRIVTAQSLILAVFVMNYSQEMSTTTITLKWASRFSLISKLFKNLGSNPWSSWTYFCYTNDLSLCFMWKICKEKTSETDWENLEFTEQ